MSDVVMRRDRGTAAWCCTAVVVAFLASGIAAAIHGWRPSWDTAFIQLRVLDVGTGRTPLIGMPSTVSEALAAPAHHPGPLHVWLLAIPNVLTRGWPAGLAIAQAIVNAALAVVSILAVGHAVGRRWASAATGLWLAAMVAVGDEVLHDPWNPHQATIALVAAAIVAAAVCARRPHGPATDASATPSALAVAALVLTASLAAQAHLAAAIPAAALVVTAFAVVVVRLVRAHGWRQARHLTRRAGIVATITGVLCWSGPLVDQAIHDPGNLRTLLTGGDSLGTTFGVVAGFDRLAAAAVPPGLFRSGLPAIATGAQRWFDRIALLAFVAVAAAFAHRRSKRDEDNAVPVVALTLAGATWLGQAITPVTFGSVFGRHMWELQWPAIIALWFTLGWAALDVARSTLPNRHPAPSPLPVTDDTADSHEGVGRRVFASSVPATATVALTVAVAVMLVLLVRPAVTDVVEQRDGRWFTAIAAAVRAVPDDPPTLTIVTDGIAIESELVAGVAADLQRRGTFVRLSGTVSAGLLHPDREVAAPTGEVLLITTRPAGALPVEPLAVVPVPPETVSAADAPAIRLYLVAADDLARWEGTAP